MILHRQFGCLCEYLGWSPELLGAGCGVDRMPFVHYMTANAWGESKKKRLTLTMRLLKRDLSELSITRTIHRNSDYIKISLKIAMQISWKLFVQLQKLFTSVAFTCLGHPVPSEGEPVDRGSWRVEMGWPIVGTETQTPRCSNTTCAAHVVYHPLFRCTRRGDQSLGFRLSYEKDTPEAQLNYLKNYKFNALWQP